MDDAESQTVEVTPSQSTNVKSKRNSLKNSAEFLDVPITPSSSSPKLRRHLSGSDGNLAIAGISESSRGVIRRASCNERKTKSKHDNLYRRPRADSKVTRSTSDPHNKPAREDVLHSAGRLSRSSSAKQPNTITEGELQMLTETSVDLESPRSTTSISEVDLTESVDMDEIQMSLSPENEHVQDITPNDGINSSDKESAEKLKLLLAQKVSKATSVKDGETSPRESSKRSTRAHGERKRVPRASSIERARKLGERRLAIDVGNVDSSSSELKESRKTKLMRSSSGSRQLPDPSQISGKSRSLPKTEGNESVDGAQCNGIEMLENTSRISKNDLSSTTQDAAVDASENSRSNCGAQAPPIKAPLIAGLSLNRNGSNGTDISRKRNQLPKRSSPVLSRKSPDVIRKSMDDQLFETKTSPPIRRAKSEADTPLESIRSRSRHSSHSRNSEKSSEQSRSTEAKNVKNNSAVDSSDGTVTRNSHNLEGSHSRNSENSRQTDKSRSRSRKALIDSDTTRRSSADNTGSKQVINPSQDKNISNSTNSIVHEDAGNSNAGDKPRRQMKKYRARDHKKLAQVDGKVSNVDEHVEPLMLEST